MARRIRALIAVCAPAALGLMRRYIEEADFRLVGMVDPSLQGALATWQGHADLVITMREDLRWFHTRRRRPEPVSEEGLKVIVLLEQSHVLEIGRLSWPVIGAVFRHPAPERVGRALRLAASGYCVLPQRSSGVLSMDELRLGASRGLTSGERCVLALLGRGLPNRTIAQALGISDARVKTQVRSVLSKLHLENRTAAAVFTERNRARLLGGDSAY